MKNKKYLILFICVVIILAIVCATVMVFSNSGDTNAKNKVKEEIYYMETKILGMLNALNNIPFSNSVLLEQNTIKGQEKSSGGSSGSSSQGSGSESGSGDSSSSSGSSDSSSGGSQSGGNTDYTKYNVQNKNILELDENQIDWNYIKNTVELLHTSWTTIMIDLHSLNIKNDDILSFSNNLDALILNIEKEDKRTTLNSLASLYSIIPIYINQYSDDNYEENIAYTKSHIISSYVLLEDDKWEDMQTEITKAQEYFTLVINSVNTKNSQIFINKTYVLLNEMKNSINLKDKKLYYMKYKNLMENIMNI